MSAAPERLPVAVVGAGEFGRNHARVYGELHNTELLGIFDLDAAKARAVADEFHTRVFGDLEGLRGCVKAASVAVPTEAHSEVGCRLWDMGIELLVEKRMATDLTQADSLLAAAKRNQRS